MLIAQDGPSRAERLGELHRTLLADVPRMREVQFRIGRTLLEIRRLEDFTALGTTTYAMYCETAGLSPVEGREYLAMVQAAAVQPEVEAKVLEAKLTPQKATVICEIQKKALHEEGEDLIALAQSKSAKDLTLELKCRKEEARMEEPPVLRQFPTSAKGSRAFNRCCDLLGRRTGQVVSEGEGLETISFYFLDREDPEWEAERLREKDEKAKASLKERPLPSGTWTVEDLERSRYIAAMTRRDIIRVVGDRCWVKDCPNEIFLEFAHRTPHRANGSTRTWNLLHLCTRHHCGLDGGEWKLRRRSDGVWILAARTGRPCGELLPDVGRYLDQLEEIRIAQGRAPP